MPDLIVPILYAMLQLFIFVALGIFIGKSRFWESSAFRSVNKFLITFALPSFLFSRIIKTDIQFLKNSLIFPAAAFITISLGLIAGYLLGKSRKLDSGGAKAISALSGFGNCGYLPLALVEILPISIPLIGEKFGTIEPALYVGTFVLVFSPYFWSVGYYLVTGTKTRIRVSDFITPPFLGVVLAFFVLLTGLQPLMLNEKLPFLYLTKAVEKLGDVTFPLVLVSLGALISSLKINREQAKAHLLTASISVFVRFLLLPGLFFLIFVTVLKPSGVSPAVSWVLFLESFTPPATNFSVMADRTPENQETISFTLLVTYSFYLVLFPVALMIFLSIV